MYICICVVIKEILQKLFFFPPFFKEIVMYIKKGVFF